MNKLGFIKIILIIAFYVGSSFFVSTAFGNNVNDRSLKKSDFSFVIDFTEGPESGKVYLLGKYSAGIDVTLLHKKQAIKCTAQTTSNIIQMESSGAYLTEIKGKCVKPQIYELAVIGKNVESYEPIKAKIINDTKKISAFDKQAKRSKALLHLRDKNQDRHTMDFQNLGGGVPHISYFNIPSGELYIISYIDNVFKRPGPRVAAHKGTIYPLTGWCSYDDLNIFLLNSEYYILSGSFCCGCGVTEIELFKVSSTGIIKWISDSSLSD